MAGGLAEARQGDQAIRIATGIEDPWYRAEALAETAKGMAEAGQVDRAVGLAAQAAQVAGGIEDSWRRARVAAQVVRTLWGSRTRSPVLIWAFMRLVRIR